MKTWLWTLGERRKGGFPTAGSAILDAFKTFDEEVRKSPAERIGLPMVTLQRVREVKEGDELLRIDLDKVRELAQDMLQSVLIEHPMLKIEEDFTDAEMAALRLGLEQAARKWADDIGLLPVMRQVGLADGAPRAVDLEMVRLLIETEETKA